MAWEESLEDFFKLVDNGMVLKTFKPWARMKAELIWTRMIAELIRASPLIKQIISIFYLAVLISCMGMVLLSLWRHRSSVRTTLIFLGSIPMLWIRSEGSWIAAAWVFIRHFPLEIYRNCRIIEEHDSNGDPMSRMALLPKQYWLKLNPMNLFRKQVKEENKKKNKKKKKTGASIPLAQNAASASTAAVTAVEFAKMAIEMEGEPIINYTKAIPVDDMSPIPALDMSEKLAKMVNTTRRVNRAL